MIALAFKDDHCVILRDGVVISDTLTQAELDDLRERIVEASGEE